jgi:hypothetical protein
MSRLHATSNQESQSSSTELDQAESVQIATQNQQVRRLLYRLGETLQEQNAKQQVASRQFMRRIETTCTTVHVEAGFIRAPGPFYCSLRSVQCKTEAEINSAPAFSKRESQAWPPRTHPGGDALPPGQYGGSVYNSPILASSWSRSIDWALSVAWARGIPQQGYVYFYVCQRSTKKLS